MKTGPFVYIVGWVMPWFGAYCLGACAPAADSGAPGSQTSPQTIQSVDANTTKSSGNANTTTPAIQSNTGTGTGTISLPDLGNITIPNIPLPANLQALLQQLANPAILDALAKAVQNNVCSSELNQLDTQQQALLKNIGALLGQGPAPDLQPVTDAANAFLKCIATAVPEVGQALNEANLGGSKVVVRAAATGDADGFALPVPGAIGEMVEQLTAPEVMAALQRARESHACRVELENLEGTTGPILARATTALETLQSRPAADMRPAASALRAFMQCMSAR